MNALNEIIPGTWRKPLYAIYALIGVIGGAIAVAYGDAQPEWLTISTNVYLFVGGALGLTAAANTDTVTKSSLPGDWAGADSDEVIPVDEDDEEFEDDNVDDLPAVTDEDLAAAEVDDTPPPEGYQPRH